MILIDAQRLKFLLRGRYVTIVLNEDRRVWRKGRTYAVGVHHSKPAICRAQIIRVERQDDAKIALTLQHAHEDELRLLGKKGGYVTNVAAALPDEPEAIDELTQRRYADQGRARDRERTAERRREQRDRIAEQLIEMRADLHDDPDRRVAKAIRAIEHQLGSISRTFDEAA